MLVRNEAITPSSLRNPEPQIFTDEHGLEVGHHLGAEKLVNVPERTIMFGRLFDQPAFPVPNRRVFR
jgi:hypothetical protein